MKIVARTEEDVQFVDPEGTESFDRACKDASELVSSTKEIRFIVIQKEKTEK